MSTSEPVKNLEKTILPCKLSPESKTEKAVIDL
jgi:hypothetical protein